MNDSSRLKPETRARIAAGTARFIPQAKGRYDRAFLGLLDRTSLRRALWLLRRQDARPGEVSPAAAQYFGLATSSSVRAEYRRRGWKIPKPTRQEQS